ncbi:MAG: Membrane dipeptidase (Peptidase family M19) [Bacteroidetes bacterium ADurb.BinA245]|jgi:membrane dipeptidase|nr:MAG: Membrane dipeptidase (Peptidase family M19) [Bacteroidetes bacterium ADurb.BinA245]HNA91430.1 dipeptidase [Chitinophagaceae bacterium]HNN99565.1 dipeptidase [Chitinophagaceae bacterium]
MKHLITFILLLVCINTLAQRYKKIHFRSVLIDTHNDIPSTAIEKGVSFDEDTRTKTHSDLNRMLQGGVDAQLFSIWCDGNKVNPYQWANREMDTVLAWTNRNPYKMMLALTANDMMKASRQNKLGVAFGVEGGHMIENDLNKLESLYKKGARYMTLTWNNSTDWATSAQDETTKGDSLKHKGLTDFGKTVVHKMNELGMLVDLSHVGEQTFWDAIRTSTKPVLVSHSCVYALCPHRRNLKDDQIKAIGENGGVIHLNFYSGFVDPEFEKRSDAFTAKHKSEMDSLLKVNPEPYFMQVFLFEKYPDEVKALRPPLSMLMDHLDYIVKMIGVDHVGIGSDFDGVNSLPQQLDDVTCYPVITKELLKRGYSKKDVRKILGGNFLRLLRENEVRQ